MQFGIFSVSDITRDPVSGQTPTEAERIDAITAIASNRTASQIFRPGKSVRKRRNARTIPAGNAIASAAI